MGFFNRNDLAFILWSNQLDAKNDAYKLKQQPFVLDVNSNEFDSNTSYIPSAKESATKLWNCEGRFSASVTTADENAGATRLDKTPDQTDLVI